MFRHIKPLLLILTLCLLCISCTNDHFGTGRVDHTVKVDSTHQHSTKRDHYTLWKLAPNNISQAYQNYKIYIGKDSIKIFDADTLICSGEIALIKNTYAGYFKSIKTGDCIKMQLKKDFGLAGKDEILEITNADGDISNKGCQSPFNEMFIADGYLFFYKDGYHAFTSDQGYATKEIQNQFKFSGLSLPYYKRSIINQQSIKSFP